MEYFERLRTLIDRKNISPSEFGRFMGYDDAQISKIFAGKVKKPQRKTAQKIAEYFGANVDWVHTGTGSPFLEVGQKEPSPKIATLTAIPVLGRVPAGIPELAEEYIESYVTIPDAPSDSYALKVTGESMEPGISHGDYVLFVIDQDAKHNDVVIVNDEFGDSMIKRLKEKDGEYLLVSDNPKYPTYKPNGHYRIMGVVVGGWRPLKL